MTYDGGAHAPGAGVRILPREKLTLSGFAYLRAPLVVLREAVGRVPEKVRLFWKKLSLGGSTDSPERKTGHRADR